MKPTLIPFLLILLTAACNNSKPDEEVLNLQHKAVQADWKHDAPDSALYYIDQAIALQPNDVSSYLIKSEVLTSRGLCAKALEMAESMPAEVKASVGGKQLLGMVLEHTGQTDEAINIYASALKDLKEPAYTNATDIHLFTSYWFLLTASGQQARALESMAKLKNGPLPEKERPYLESFEPIIASYQGGGLLELMQKQAACPGYGS